MGESYFGDAIGKLGFGFMRLPRLGGQYDDQTIAKMVDLFLAEGYNYFDTAYIYEGSEQALCRALVSRYPREKYRLATKLPMITLEKPEDMQKAFDTSLARLGTPYIDYYMLHSLSGNLIDKAEELDAWTFLKKLKADGLIKHWGFSFHDTADKLEALLVKHPDTEFVQLQINYLDWESEEVQSRAVYETARRHGIPIVIMEPVKGGLLASEDSPIDPLFKDYDPSVSLASWAIRFAAGLDGVITVLSGMSSMAQLEDNLKTMKAFKPFTEADRALLQKAADKLNEIPRVPCTDCKYCLSNCPQKINIPELIDLYNRFLVYHTTVNSEFPFFLATVDGGKPSDCIACHICEEHCPQHIAISDTMVKIAEVYEK